MKAAFFSVLALAATAFASPISTPVGDVKQVNGAVKTAEQLVPGSVGVEQIVDEATKTPIKTPIKAPVKRGITDPQQLITTLKGAVHTLNSQTTGINDIVDKVKAGDLTKVAGATKAIPMFEEVQSTLNEVVTKLTGAAGLNVPDVDVDTVLSLVVVLVSQVLNTVKTVISVIGLRPELISILHSVFQILSKLLTLITGLVGAIVPGLVSALTPLLSGLGSSALAPVLTPLSGLLSGPLAGLPL
ncbi:hypothetical protein FALBO_6834 [Fusarium albosuccineum]|uniref:Uncharacterized protein n=1 Tax=Fusarium albosuccineum TaxID=1237068 RepID=A0A8H4LBD2_9HYPO|nr:hypothetical protein FALBO_6834 [Fusarium albosuccineum]